ncbi:hypothetical protein C4565_05780 [Candidatus Parcubacteria bacterium]|nr:MAG: hypothetical protein C4565_05780 [Candidatus Parcubacteria bacterium]
MSSILQQTKYIKYEKGLVTFGFVVLFGLIILWIANRMLLIRSDDFYHYSFRSVKPLRAFVKGQLKSKDTFFCPNSQIGFRQRLYKKLMLLERKPEIMILGSSHSLKIKAEMFNLDPELFYNAGIVSGTTLDNLSLWQYAIENNLNPKLIIYVASGHDLQWLPNAEFYPEIIEIIRKVEPKSFSSKIQKYALMIPPLGLNIWQQFKYGLRFYSLKDILMEHLLTGSKRKALLKREHNSSEPFLEKSQNCYSDSWGFHYDGSIVYGTNLESTSFDNRERLKHYTKEKMAEYKKLDISTGILFLLDVFLNDAKSRGVTVLFLFPPRMFINEINQIEPAYENWNIIVADKLKQISNLHGYEFHYFDRAEYLGCGINDFHGVSHPREICYSKILSKIAQNTNSQIIKRFIRTN